MMKRMHPCKEHLGRRKSKHQRPGLGREPMRPEEACSAQAGRAGERRRQKMKLERWHQTMGSDGQTGTVANTTKRISYSDFKFINITPNCRDD